MKIKSTVGTVVVILSLCTSLSCFAEDEEVSYDPLTGHGNFSVEPVLFPAVPPEWSQSIVGNTIVYKSPVDKKTKTSLTTVKLTYTKNTHGLDAKGYIDEYSKNNSCKDASAVAVGFYQTQCPTDNSFVVAIGERENLYIIEFVGLYDQKAKLVVDSYVKDITTGKNVFYNRHIGDEIKGH